MLPALTLSARVSSFSGATKVAILDLNEAAAKQAATELSEYWVAEGLAAPGELEAVGLACDVSNETSVQGAFDTVVSKFGKIDIMTNSAGIVENFPATEYPTDKTRKLVDINIMGSFFTAREAAKRMQKGGSIILIGSMSGMVSSGWWHQRRLESSAIGPLLFFRSSTSLSPKRRTTFQVRFSCP